MQNNYVDNTLHIKESAELTPIKQYDRKSEDSYQKASSKNKVFLNDVIKIKSIMLAHTHLKNSLFLCTLSIYTQV